jgi:predicted phosphoribosyltransferase
VELAEALARYRDAHPIVIGVARGGVPVAAAVARALDAELDVMEAEPHGPLAVLSGRTVILVDDGLATGARMRAAVRSVRSQTPHHLVVAVPVGSVEACRVLRNAADEVVCLHEPTEFGAVCWYYHDFTKVQDNDIEALLGEFASASWRSACHVKGA